MKRVIALFLVCILAIPILTVSASATANDAYEVPYVDLFDMGYWLVDGEATTNFNLAAGQTGTFDTTVWITTVEIAYASSSAAITINGKSYTGTETAASGVYAVKASISTKTGLTIGTDSGLSLLTCKARLKGTAYTHPTFDVVTEVGSTTDSATGQSDYLFNMDTTTAYDVEVNITFKGSDLQSTSFLDLDIRTSEFKLTGIKVVNGTRALPYTTNSLVYEMDGTGLTYDSADDFFFSNMKLSIDTSSAFISAYDLYITLYGVLIAENDGNAMFNLRINNVAACPDLSAPNAQNGLLTKIWNSIKTGFTNVTSAISSLLNESVGWFSDIYDNITITRETIVNFLAEMFSGEDAGDPDDFNSDVDQQETQFQEMVDTMETAPTVDVDEVGGMIGSIEDIQNSQTNSFYMGIISGLIELEIFQPIYLFTGLLCILGYLLYGKR